MIVLIMTTFAPAGGKRHELALKSLKSLTWHLASIDDIRLHVADDGSEPQAYDYISELLYHADSYFCNKSTFSNSRRQGIGASLNLAMQSVGPDDYWMYTTDDWFLNEDLSLRVPLALLSRGYDYVRLGPIHSGLACVTRFANDLEYWLELLPLAGGFCFATRPFIANRRFYDVVGPFDEGVNVYQCEQLYAERVKSFHTQVKLAYAGAMDETGRWRHIGDDHQVGHLLRP